jgi:osmotically-inducible protein OsmY
MAAAVALIAILVLPRGAGIREATAESSVDATAVQPASVIIEERNDGFGLGDAQISDEELAQQVRDRLGACKELVDARVSFSVKDGWVWLRGEATPRARRAAEEALQALPPGSFVVNQLVTSSGGDTIARR